MQMSEAIPLPYVERTIGDSVRKFGKLTPRDRASVLRNLRQRRKNALIANLGEAGIPNEQRFAELEAFDDAPLYGEDRFIEYINTPEGQDEIHLMGLKKYPADNPDPEMILGQWITADRDDGLKLAADICSLTLAKPEESAGAKLLKAMQSKGITLEEVTNWVSAQEAKPAPEAGSVNPTEPQPGQGYGT